LLGTRPTLVGHTGRVEEDRTAADKDALARIHDLVAEEKTLREQLQHGDINASEEHERLRRIEIELDQCWDLLRQRRALRETGGDPREARVRPPDEVEDYLG
jgi:uncharacterized protein DUF2630